MRLAMPTKMVEKSAFAAEGSLSPYPITLHLGSRDDYVDGVEWLIVRLHPSLHRF
jgi:hypothetical protein